MPRTKITLRSVAFDFATDTVVPAIAIVVIYIKHGDLESINAMAYVGAIAWVYLQSFKREVYNRHTEIERKIEIRVNRAMRELRKELKQ